MICQTSNRNKNPLAEVKSFSCHVVARSLQTTNKVYIDKNGFLKNSSINKCASNLFHSSASIAYNIFVL